MNSILLISLLLIATNLSSQDSMPDYYYEYQDSFKAPIMCYDDLPAYIRADLDSFIEIYKPSYIRIFGSYVNGNYHNHQSSDRFKWLKSKVYDLFRRKMSIQSDLDIITDVNIDDARWRNLNVFPTGYGGVFIYESQKGYIECK